MLCLSMNANIDAGKTTLLRDVSRVLSDEYHLHGHVIVVDTSMEIAGHGRAAHGCIGDARRMAVPRREIQYQILMEAYSNHGPKVIIIDELGTEPEVKAARAVAERGVSLIATGHGRNLQSIISNPDLSTLGT